MPSIGPTELFLVFIIALVVLGPKRLPEVGRQIGRALREFRSATSQIRSELGVDEIVGEVKSVRSELGVDEIVGEVKSVGSGLGVDEVGRELKQSANEVSTSFNDASASLKTDAGGAEAGAAGVPVAPASPAAGPTPLTPPRDLP